jgi:hypothetical protein
MHANIKILILAHTKAIFTIATRIIATAVLNVSATAPKKYNGKKVIRMKKQAPPSKGSVPPTRKKGC